MNELINKIALLQNGWNEVMNILGYPTTEWMEWVNEYLMLPFYGMDGMN